MIDTNAPVTRKDLRQFGLLMGAFLPLFVGLLIPYIWDLSFPIWPFVVGAIFALVGLAFPLGLQPIYKIWMKFAAVLGWINSRILLGLIFYLTVTPIALLMKLFAKDPMSRKLESEADSYKVISDDRKADEYERPF